MSPVARFFYLYYLQKQVNENQDQEPLQGIATYLNYRDHQTERNQLDSMLLYHYYIAPPNHE